MTIKITDADIRDGIDYAIASLTEDCQISVPDDGKTDFVDDCVSTIVDGIEMYGWNPFLTEERYEEIVLDMADTYGYNNY